MEEQRNVEEEVILPGKLGEFREALRDEIKKIEKSGQSSTLLKSGHPIEGNGSDFWYSFRVDYLPSIPADTPCKLIIGKNTYNVVVVSFDESEIVVSSAIEINDSLGMARLENGATVLMELLIKRIESNSKKENPSGDRMLPDNGLNVVHTISNSTDIYSSGNLTSAQKDAVRSAINNDITYIWGPPGTGKTTVIGDIIWNLYLNKRSVLIVSHTNTAVDGAIEKVVFEKGSNDRKVLVREDGSCPVLRIGMPQKDLPEEVLLKHHTQILGAELYTRQQELQEEHLTFNITLQNKLTVVSKYEWKETTQISTLLATVAMLDILNEEKLRKSAKFNQINQEKEEYIKNNPEIKEYDALQQKKEELETKYEKEHSLLLRTKESISKYTDDSQRARDEIAKHRVYDRLTEQLNGMMSEKFLRDKISEIKQYVLDITYENVVLEQRHKELQEIIAQGTRNALVTVFARKSVEDAKIELIENEKSQEINVENIQISSQRLASYEKHFLEVKSLLQQREDVIPAETIDFWETKQNDAEKSIKNNQITLDGAKAILEKLKNDLSDCNDRLISLKDKVIKYQQIINARNVSEKEYHKAYEDYEKANTECQQYYDREIKVISLFARINLSNEQNWELRTNELKDIYESVSAEVSLVNIVKEKEDINSIRARIPEIIAELNAIAEQIKNLEKEAIEKASIVGATLAKTYLSDILQELDFDTVILDEASMASIPALWCASYIAKNNIVIVGDFLQLPPIVMADTPLAKKWLGTDIFAISGMQECAKHSESKPSNFIMLNEQFRMEEDIANIANLYYGEYGGLISQDNLPERCKYRDEFKGWYNANSSRRPVEIVDTSDLHAWVTSIPQGKSHSRLNCYSAALSVEMAFSFLAKIIPTTVLEKKVSAKPKVLIVAPYKPHVDRIRQLIDFEYERLGLPGNANLIKVGTIHSFQGNEADIVIFDLVIDEPHWKANLFMTDTEINNNLRKLFNVAVTRAKFKLYVVGNIGYCRKRAKNNALSKLLDYLIDVQKYNIINAKDLAPNLMVSKPSTYLGSYDKDAEMVICREDEFFDYFVNDIRTFKERLIIFSPFITANRLGELLPEFHDAINAGKEIIVVTKSLSDRGKTELAQYKKYEKELSDTGVEVLHKKGMHEKIVIIDDSAIWLGSLNALSFAGNTGEIMMKHCDPRLTAETEKIYDIPHIQEAIKNKHELVCPICGERMVLGEGNSGGMYWKCSECDYSRNMDQQYPVDGILRCSCGGTFSFSMKNQPRWICNNDPKHYQIMHYGDLKLEKMAQLIPTKKERKAVDAYFKEKRKQKGIQETKRKDTSKKKVSNASGTQSTEQMSLADFGIV